LGVPKDIALARDWYQRAADKGNARAMHNLAVLLADSGASGKADYNQAAIWFRKAAERGLKDSQYNLAILYARGMGVSQDMVQSYLWFAAAADQGDADAGKKRDEVATRFDSASLTRAKDLVANYRPTPLDPAANEVAAPPGGWLNSEPARALPAKAKSAKAY
jgi:localization factor PodJL